VCIKRKTLLEGFARNASKSGRLQGVGKELRSISSTDVMWYDPMRLR
jgi:hypothetical protein